MELSGLYTPSVLLYKWFNVITIWNLLNIPQARSRSRAPSLGDGRRYSKGSYLIYCWRGKALCAGLETANSSPCLSSSHTEQLLGFNLFFFWEATAAFTHRHSPSCWSCAQVPGRGKGSFPALPEVAPALVEPGMNRGVERIQFSNQIISPQALPLSEARHNFGPCLKSSR